MSAGSNHNSGLTKARADALYAPIGGSGAPVDATYVVVSLNGTLTAERTLAVGALFSLTDAGANSSITVDNPSTKWAMAAMNY